MSIFGEQVLKIDGMINFRPESTQFFFLKLTNLV